MPWTLSTLLATATVVLSLAIAPDAFAVGAGGGGSKASASRSAGGDIWRKAKQAIAGREYEKAIPHLLKTVELNPKNADAYNYLGYSHARLGRTDDALAFYLNALKLEPEHKGANEYLGELHLMLGDLGRAEERLATLDRACTFGCVEYDLLKEAVAEYKASGKYVTSKGF